LYGKKPVAKVRMATGTKMFAAASKRPETDVPP
jgi:hypothetical protein